MRCPDCGGKKYRRNMLDREFRELERQWIQGDLGAGARILRERMRMEEIPEDYVRRAAALGDARAEALGLEPWPIEDPYYFVRSILMGLPNTLLVSFAADVAERVLYLFENTYPGDTRPRDAIIAARRWVEQALVTEASTWLCIDDPAQASQIRALHAAHDAANAAANAAYEASEDGALRALDAANAATDAAYATFSSSPADAAAATDAAIFSAASRYQERKHFFLYGDGGWKRQRLIQYLLGEVQI